MGIKHYNKLSDLPSPIKSISVLLEDGEFAEIGLELLRELLK